MLVAGSLLRIEFTTSSASCRMAFVSRVCGRFRNVGGGLIRSERAPSRGSEFRLGIPMGTRVQLIGCLAARVEVTDCGLNQYRECNVLSTAIDPGSLGGSPLINELQMRMAMSALSPVRYVRVAVTPLLDKYLSIFVSIEDPTKNTRKSNRVW